MKRVLLVILAVFFGFSNLFSQHVKSRVFLQGAYLSNSTMDTSLNGVIPLNQPYFDSPWEYHGVEQISYVFQGVVDWVLVELRDAADVSIIKGRRAALLMSDGLVVDTNLQAYVDFGNLSSGQYYIAVYHRNHIPVMSASPIVVPNAVPYDFSDTLNYPSYGGGNQALIKLEQGVYGMIAGDVNKDGVIKYSGPGNDRAAVLQYILSINGGSTITSSVNGYRCEDINMDSTIKYSGPANDPSLIIQNLVNLNSTSSITSVYNSKVPAGIIYFQCGDTLIDERDGQKYATVQIGNQCWMAENLNFGTKIVGLINQSDNGTIEKYCYEDDESMCNNYGGLYQWGEMMDYTTVEGARGICPSGWHIPSDAEWKVLEGTIDSYYGVGDPHWDMQGNRGTDAACNMIETGSQYWPIPNQCATNSSGFSARPGGCLFFTGVFYFFSVNAFFWTSTEQNNLYAWYRSLYNNSNFIERSSYDKNRAYSVRCLRDD